MVAVEEVDGDRLSYPDGVADRLVELV